VEVSLDYVLDLQALRFGFINVPVDVALWINHDRFAFRPNQVRSMRQTREIELLEVHISQGKFNRQDAKSAKLTGTAVATST
jgi:hypothetical protein